MSLRILILRKYFSVTLYLLDRHDWRKMYDSRRQRPDVFGNVSNVIALHACCNGYEPNFDTTQEKKEVIVDDNK